MALRPLARLRDSARMLWSWPLMSFGFGAALVGATASVCCGLGWIAAPWLACELSATQLGWSTSRRPPYRWSWLGAASLELAVLVLLTIGGALVTTWLGTLEPLDPASPRSTRGLVALPWALATTVAAVAFVTPFLYAPHLLLDRGGRMIDALIDSARIVRGDGWGRHVGMSWIAASLAIAPVLVAATGAIGIRGRDAVPFAVLGSLPLLAVTVPLGRGVVTAAYAERRPLRSAQGLVRPSKPLIAALVVTTLLPLLALIGIAASVVVRPARPQPGEAPPGEAIARVPLSSRQGPRSLHVPATTLELRLAPNRVAVVSGGGGGAGRIPLPQDARLDAARLVRVGDVYALELADGSRRWVTWIDRAGVRLDDDLSARLTDHVPARGLALLVASLLVTPVAIGRALSNIGHARERALSERDGAPDGTERASANGEELQWALRRAGGTAVALALLGLGALAYAVRAL